jgi:hypothetical protein
MGSEGRRVVKDVIVLGDSHSHCLAVAAGHAPQHLRVVMADAGTITDEFVMRTMDGAVVINPLIQHALARIDAVDHFSGEFLFQGELCLLFGFTAAHRLGYNPFWKSWRLSGSGAAISAKPRGAITEPMLADMLAHELRHFREGLSLLARKAGRAIHLLPGPPPYPTNAAIVESRGAKADMFPDPRIRLTIWKATDDLLAGWARETADISRIALPPDVFDEDGYLKAEYLATDGIHANQAYGARLLRHLEQVFA